MTELLKEGFIWIDDATRSFTELKHLMVRALVLKYPYFAKPFVVEIDSCNTNISVVLIQDKHSVAFFNSKISRHLSQASTYMKEMTTITQAIAKWQNYLLGLKVVIPTDHKSLKNLLL